MTAARPSLVAVAVCSWLCSSWTMFALPLVSSRGATGLLDAIGGALWAPVAAPFVVVYLALGGGRTDPEFPLVVTGLLVGAVVGASLPWMASRLGGLPWNR